MSELVGLQTGVQKEKARPHIGFVYTKDNEDDFQSVTEQDEPPSRHPGWTFFFQKPYYAPTYNPLELQRQSSTFSNSLDPNNRQLHAELSSFVQKKSFAQNMMDIALLSANTNQLRYVIDLGAKHPYYMTSLLLISVSLVMQIVVGLSMVYLNRYNMKDKTEMKAASHMNNLSVAGVFLVTLVNVFISTFNGAGVDVIPTETDGLINSSNLTQNITPPAAYFT
ncbi:ninjurin-B-like [Anopheles funestus]|uniref:ninjurin-B-like n=1 Tax=Anopheles funestus TaxID=62324 RepID=UPI0020C68E38|nr:ninjurin-B-like [Anopheles funestus]